MKIKEELLELSHEYFEMNQASLQSVNENWSFFSQNLQKIVQTYTPTKTLSTRIHLPWLSPALKRLIHKKQRVYRKAKRYRRDEDWYEYKRLQKEVDHNLKVSTQVLSEKFSFRIRHDIKSRKQENNGISALKNPINGHIVADPVTL